MEVTIAFHRYQIIGPFYNETIIVPGVIKTEFGDNIRVKLSQLQVIQD